MQYMANIHVAYSIFLQSTCLRQPCVPNFPSGPLSGTAMDWHHGVAGIPYPYVLELRDDGEFGFLLPPEYIEPSGFEILEGVKAMALDFIAKQESQQRQNI